MAESSLTIEAKIEAVLFFKAEPVSVSKLAEILSADKVNETEIKAALMSFEKNLSGRGLVLVRNGNDVMLETAPEAATLMESLIKEDLSREIGRAGLEVLSIVLYRGPVTKRDIDYIRGVNSSLVLRNLLIRGLVERADERGARGSFIYRPTFALLSHLGLKNIEELPEYDIVNKEIGEFETKNDES
ncbi:MAG: SMC-Scp complex subunit ScpB [Patescibacteria group bacterium]